MHAYHYLTLACSEEQASFHDCHSFQVPTQGGTRNERLAEQIRYPSFMFLILNFQKPTSTQAYLATCCGVFNRWFCNAFMIKHIHNVGQRAGWLIKTHFYQQTSHVNHFYKMRKKPPRKLNNRISRRSSGKTPNRDWRNALVFSVDLRLFTDNETYLSLEFCHVQHLHACLCHTPSILESGPKARLKCTDVSQKLGWSAQKWAKS